MWLQVVQGSYRGPPPHLSAEQVLCSVCHLILHKLGWTGIGNQGQQHNPAAEGVSYQTEKLELVFQDQGQVLH